MSGHLLAEEIERFRARVLPPDELVGMHDHLAACESCRARVKAALQPQATLNSLLTDLADEARREPEHLPYEQIAAYVDDELSEPDCDPITSHLAWCGQCSVRVQALRAIKAELAARPAKEPVAVSDYAPARSPRFWQRLTAFRLPSYRMPLGIAAAAALVLICAWLVLHTMRQRAQLDPSSQQAANATPQSGSTPLLRTGSPTPPQIDAEASNKLIALNDGGRQITINERGEIAGLGSLPPADEQAIKEALTAQRIVTPPGLANLTEGSASLLRGASAGLPFALVSPVGAVVTDARPTFRWRKLAGASGYRVKVFDEGFQRVASSELLTDAQWQMPEPLARGRVYLWQVIALKDGEEIKSPVAPAPEARFKVLDSTSATALEQARRTHHDSHLVLGVLYVRAGLLDDAEREFRLLRQANPESPVAQTFLRQVQSIRQRAQARH